MSLFKKLTEGFEDIKAGLKDKNHGEHGASHSHEHAHPAPPYDSYPGASHNPDSYGRGPPGDPGMSLPPGWIARFDPSAQRWFYAEEATGHTQWEAPRMAGPTYFPPSGHGIESQGYYPPHPSAMGTHGTYPAHGMSGMSSKGGMLMGGAPGLAVGALAKHALGGNSASHYPHGGHGLMQSDPSTGYYSEQQPFPTESVPTETASGDEVSGSDQEDVLEARQEYEEAQLAAADEDASGSEREEAEEAREEYEEEYEEAYED